MSSEGNKKRNVGDAFAAEKKEEEKICRFCFDGEEESEDETLIAPCDCKGGQKYIHLSCLRQWQRMVLVSQPTHPDFWEDDVRHRKCNVCKADFSCEPPSRQELFCGFTGPEIAALIESGCIIASHENFNQMIQEQLSNPIVALLSGVRHWLKGVYLITKVQEDKGDIEYTIDDRTDVDELLENLDNDLCLEIGDGVIYKLQTEGSLVECTNKQSLQRLIAVPSRLVFRPTIPTNCTDDKVAAVNLTRIFKPTGVLARQASNIIGEAKAQDVDVTYYRGGPCDEERIVWCLVLGGRRSGYTILKDFRTALLLAKRNAAHTSKEGRNSIAVGQDVVLQGLAKRPDLNGKRGLVQAYDETLARFEVRLFEQEQQDDADNENGTEQAPSSGAVDIKRVRPDNLKAHASGIGKNGTVYAFCGDARWTRAQLLGEIAKASWGLCQAQTADLFVTADKLYDQVLSRLVYAPESAMTEQHSRSLVALRRGAMEVAQYVHERDDAGED